MSLTTNNLDFKLISKRLIKTNLESKTLVAKILLTNLDTNLEIIL